MFNYAPKELTVQDYFAAQAVAGLLANPSLQATNREYVEIAWTIARDMMKAKEQHDNV